MGLKGVFIDWINIWSAVVLNGISDGLKSWSFILEPSIILANNFKLNSKVADHLNLTHFWINYIKI